jgi:serine/threonine protein kinase
MVQLLDALQHAHDQGVWHRDVKPANMIIMTSGKLKIADFGIALIDTSTLTQTGVVMGSPGYMAPEQYSGGKVDRRADLFAAGVVMYQLLTGARPFDGSVESVPYKICHVELPLPSETAGSRLGTHNAVITRARGNRRIFQTATGSAAILGPREAVAATISEETIIAAHGRAAMLFEPTAVRAHAPRRHWRAARVAHRRRSARADRHAQLPGTRAGTQAGTQSIAPPASHRSLWLVGAGAAAVALLGVGVGMPLRPALRRRALRRPLQHPPPTRTRARQRGGRRPRDRVCPVRRNPSYGRVPGANGAPPGESAAPDPERKVAAARPRRRGPAREPAPSSARRLWRHRRRPRACRRPGEASGATRC